MELSTPFVRLPFVFDSERLVYELGQLENNGTWMPHPSGLVGNSAIPLISLNGEDNDDFAGHMSATPRLATCEYMLQVMASFGEVLSRSRLMRLDAGAEVSAHVDFNYHWYSRVRIHIPVVTNPDVIFYCGDQQVHMQPGECWIFDSWRRHNVINSGDQNRVHLVVDIAGSSRFWDTVRQMEPFGLETDSPELKFLLRDVPYIKGHIPELHTERFNVAPIMSPGEMEAIARELILDFSSHPANDPLIIEEYKQLLLGLSKDWRETWHLYGYNKEGWPNYKMLLDRTLKQLRPNPRVLITGSNSVGVNPIIVQRILRAALHLDQMQLISQ